MKCLALKGTRQNMKFLSSATAEERSSQQSLMADTSGDVEFSLPPDRDVEGCWRTMVLRLLLACIAGSAVRVGGNRATVGERQDIHGMRRGEEELKDSKSFKCFASRRDCTHAGPGRATAHSLWWTCRKCGLQWPRVH